MGGRRLDQLLANKLLVHANRGKLCSDKSILDEPGGGYGAILGADPLGQPSGRPKLCKYLFDDVLPKRGLAPDGDHLRDSGWGSEKCAIGAIGLVGLCHGGPHTGKWLDPQLYHGHRRYLPIYAVQPLVGI